MKKFLAVLLAMAMVFCLAACGEKEPAENAGNETNETTANETNGTAANETENQTENTTSNETEETSDVMSYADYAAAAVDDEVTVECYVQVHQGWWENEGKGVVTVYAQDEDGAYFLYNMECTEEDAAKLVPGTKIKAHGFKSEWSGEVEIVDASFEFEEGSWIAEAKDVTDLLGKDELINEQNKFVAFKGMTVASKAIYKYDGSGSQGDDLYFDVELNGNKYTFTVESYLCGADTEVYKAVEALEEGQVVDMEGFLYWYEGVNPHITKVTPAVSEGDPKAVMSYADYAAAAVDDPVTIECYVQAHQGWWENEGKGVVTVYGQDEDGAYFMYDMACTEEDAAKLVPGTKIKVTGFKSEWSGEVEIVDASFEFEEGNWIAEAKDVTDLLGKDELVNEQNKFVAFKGMTVASKALYKWDGSGAQGDDLYFDVELDGNKYTFTVESYLCGADTEVYKAVEALEVGQKIDLEGFCYWYEGLNPHITKVTVVE